MKTFSKLITIFSLIFFATSCASQKYFTYADNGKSMPQHFKLSIKKVNVKLIEATMLAPQGSSRAKYPDAKKVGRMMEEGIEKILQDVGLYSGEQNDPDVLECEIDVNYGRVFAVFSNEQYAGSTLEGYKIRVYKNGKVIAEREDKALYGALQDEMGNLRKTSRTISGKANALDEKIEIEIFAEAIARNLLMLGR